MCDPEKRVSSFTPHRSGEGKQRGGKKAGRRRNRSGDEMTTGEGREGKGERGTTDPPERGRSVCYRGADARSSTTLCVCECIIRV